VFRQSGVVHSFKMVDPVLLVFGSHVLYIYYFFMHLCKHSTRLKDVLRHTLQPGRMLA
jgi:hypothetical protein